MARLFAFPLKHVLEREWLLCLRLDKDTLENSVVPNRADLESEGI